MPTAPARAYAMKAREDQNAPEVIASIFSLYDTEMHALIDLLIHMCAWSMYLTKYQQWRN